MQADQEEISGLAWCVAEDGLSRRVSVSLSELRPRPMAYSGSESRASRSAATRSREESI